jgi:glutathione S-transferase
MSLTLHFHPLSSFCMKALLGLYELDLPFEKKVVDLGNPSERAALLALWPVGKFPVLRDDSRDVTLPESSLILEYLDGLSSRPGCLIPGDPERALLCRLRDRFYDLYVMLPMQKIVTDKLRPAGTQDAYGVEQARAQLASMYTIANDWMRDRQWAVGEVFTMADCAAAPSLFYANQVAPIGDRLPHLAKYLERLMRRPTFARVLDEAKPYWSMFPG